MTQVSHLSRSLCKTLLAALERTLQGRPFTALSGLVFLVALAGCAASPVSPWKSEVSLPASPQPSNEQELFTSDGQDRTDLAKLAQLWQQRTQGRPMADYPIGPGDIIEITVPAMEELTGRVVRVSGEGMIALPLIGVVKAAGVTEDELRESIRRQLTHYMHNPQLDLFVRDYRSRQVAVIGAVARPGLYNLVSESDTILDLVALAGGMRDEAAQRILLIPAEPADPGTATTLATILPAQLVSQEPSPLVLKQTDPLVIDLNNLARGGHQLYLSLPARPGDVIMVPGSGEVLVQGWVEKPGAYKITPRLTILGAVAAAGGPLFAADTSAVQVIRTGKRGERIFYVADLEKIKRGEKSDVAAQEGDVIEVTASGPKLVPYGLYRFFASIFNVGMGASVPVR
jgi:polysaccharide export outer membrane protein